MKSMCFLALQEQASPCRSVFPYHCHALPPPPFGGQPVPFTHSMLFRLRVFFLHAFRWEAFVNRAKLERHQAATHLQALARAKEAKKKAAGLRRERWASTMIARQARQCKLKLRIQNLCPYRRTLRGTKKKGYCTADAMQSWKIGRNR